MSDHASLSAATLAQAYRTGALSPVDVLASVRAKARAAEPSLNALVLADETADAQARASAERWERGAPLSPIDGVPCTIKDLIDMAGLPTRRGSHLTDATPQQDDAPLVTHLRAAGALLWAKTTTTEFGWKSPGDCPLTGITRNPCHLEHTTGGSSAGAGAAASAGYGPLHVGTDAGGSIRIPAAWCGVVGLKPTYGLVPQWPAGAFAAVSVAGPLTRTVRDAALLLGAMGRWHWRDPFSHRGEPRDWSEGIDAGVRGLRVAILRNPGFEAPVCADGAAAVARATSILAAHGAIVEAADPDLPDTAAVFGRVWGAALARLVGLFPDADRARLDPGLLHVAATQAGLSAAGLIEAEALMATVAHRMARFHQDWDLVLCPTVPRLAPRADAPLDDPATLLWRDWAPWTFLFNLSRAPAISVPMGVGGGGLPVAVQIGAAQHRDDLVLRAGYVLESVARP